MLNWETRDEISKSVSGFNVTSGFAKVNEGLPPDGMFVIVNSISVEEPKFTGTLPGEPIGKISIGGFP